MSVSRRRELIIKGHKELSIVKQCSLLSIHRSGYYYCPVEADDETLLLMRLIDEQHMETPWYGSRQMMRHLRRSGCHVSRNRVVRLMHKMGLSAIYQKPRTSIPHPNHEIYPYLLRECTVTAPNMVWCSDITYIPMQKGFLYLVAVMDWYSRRVLSWKLSNTMDTGFCLEAVEEALHLYPTPEIFNTDQGSQFTSQDFTLLLKQHSIRISMDGKGRWMDNVFIERLWRSLKYECVYLHAFETGSQLRQGIHHWIDYYNNKRPHSAFAGQTPEEVYNENVSSQAGNNLQRTDTKIAA